MCRPYIDTNNPQGMQLRRFKNRTPARFEYMHCTLFQLWLMQWYVTSVSRWVLIMAYTKNLAINV
jgi:hypothetical protein